jgi:hypothetical protein
VANALALRRLLAMSDRARDAEILAFRHQITVLERQLHGEQVRFAPADRRSWPPCCIDSLATCCAASVCWYARKPFFAGTEP